MEEKKNSSLYLVIVLFVIMAVIVGTLALIYFRKDKDKDEAKTEEQVDEQTFEETEEFIDANSISDNALTEHTTAADCWVAYKGIVYDVSSLLNDLKEVTKADCGVVIDRDISNEEVEIMEVYYIVDYQGGGTEEPMLQL